MKKICQLALAGVLFFSTAVAQQTHDWKQATAAGYTYQYVSNDPMQTRIYTLKNGLTVMLSPNKKEPRIAVRIAVRAGSNTDPKEHTGLAHYLEHLLFKGTDKFGSLNWEKEKPLLDKIDALYEQYNSTTDEAKRKEIYKEIDRVSGEASTFAIANEYDKMMTAMGAQGTNAHTWVEETVYEEDIPSNATDRFLAVQAERFRNPILRIFHTELEAVYEEKNRTMDNDGWKMQEAMHTYLFPTHNYGQQTTIGTIEHLKNPSLTAIREYYYKYYVPNNMAVIMAGDFDPDVMVRKIEQAFSYMQPKPVEEYNPAPEAPIAAPVVKEIFGPSAENMRIVYRSGKEGTREALLLSLTSSILSNGKAGLLDLNLNKSQKVLGAGAGYRQYKDYGMFFLYASPKQGQSLEQAKDLLMEQLNILKSGSFDESLIAAIVANYKLGELQALESNNNRVEALMNSFIKNKGTGWKNEVAVLDEMSKVSKAELVAFANKFFGDNNYLVLYKRKGEDKSIVKVDKPPITPVETNAGKQSPFVQQINAMPLAPIAPKWIDFSKDLQKGKIGKAELLYVPNKENALFKLYFHFDMGSWNNKKLPIALQYLQFLGTDKYSSEEISKKFYQLAANFSANAGNEESTIQLNGLQENFSEALSLLEHLVRNCKADEAALEGLKNRLQKARTNNKLNKGAIMNGLMNHAMYGASNPFNQVLTDAELNALTATELVNIIHGLPAFEHKVLYYGPLSVAALSTEVLKSHPMPSAWTAVPVKQQFTRTEQTQNEVLFATYDMVQAEMMWVRNLGTYNPDTETLTNLFNSYFGGGMGSLVFQTIRESKALAYSTYAYVDAPDKKADRFAFMGYVGSQADKLPDAVGAMNELINVLPERKQNLDAARESLLKDLETGRIDKEGIIFEYLSAQKKGLNEDIRKKQYQQLKTMPFSALEAFHKQNLSNKKYAYTIVASEQQVKPADLEKYGKVKVLTLEELFGY